MIDTSRYQHSPGCRLLLSVRNIYPNGTDQTLNFDTASWNDNGCYNFATQRWTATKSGRIMVSAGISIAFTSSSSMISYLHYDFILFNKSNVRINELRFWQTNNAERTIYTNTGVSTLFVNVGDYGVFTFNTGHTDADRQGLNPRGFAFNQASIFYLP